jgi:hypothetical protein
VYSVGADWSLAANPNGPWSYNQGTSPLPFVQVDWGGVTGETFWTTTSSGIVPPAWAKAVTTIVAGRWEPGDVVGHSTNGFGVTANITWTSPAAGWITLSGKAWDAGHAVGRDDAWRLYVAGDLVAQRSSVVGIARADDAALFSTNLQPGKGLTSLPVAAGDTVVFEIQATTSLGHFVGVDLTIDLVPAPNHIVCYKAGLVPGEPKLTGASASLQDQLGGPDVFGVKGVVALCNPADVDGEGVPVPEVHHAGFSLKGGPTFVKSDHVAVDQFGTRTLTLTGPAGLLDVARVAPGPTPPPPFDSDPTAVPTVNRYKCYKAGPARGQPKFVPPAPPTVTDMFFPGGQALELKKITKLCAPVDKDGETPGAETRADHLVCYQAKLPSGAPRFEAQTVAIAGTNFGAHVLVAKGVAEVCVPALKDP